MFLSKLLVFILALAGMPAYAMTIKAPDIAENGAVIPVEILPDRPLTAGQRIDLLVNGEPVAQVRVITGSLSAFSTRVKGTQLNTTISARVIANGGEIDAASRNIAVTISVTASGAPTVVGDMRVRALNGDLKVLMTSENGFSGILILQDTNFRVEISGTAGIARHPMVGVKGDFTDQATASMDGQTQQPVAKPAVAQPAAQPGADYDPRAARGGYKQ